MMRRRARSSRRGNYAMMLAPLLVDLLAAEGLDSRDIAEKLHITVETERTHMVNILGKLGVHSRLQALVFAARHGLVEIR